MNQWTLWSRKAKKRKKNLEMDRIKRLIHLICHNFTRPIKFQNSLHYKHFGYHDNMNNKVNMKQKFKKLSLHLMASHFLYQTKTTFICHNTLSLVIEKCFGWKTWSTKKKNWQSKKHNYTMEKSDSTAKCLVACSEKKRKLKVAANLRAHRLIPRALKLTIM
jgi:hypothetical protein